jgi:hypothetical protein
MHKNKPRKLGFLLWGQFDSICFSAPACLFQLHREKKVSERAAEPEKITEEKRGHPDKMTEEKTWPSR